MQLTEFQDGFSAALLGTGRAPATAWSAALEAQPGFAVYRNTVLKGCIDALQASYPTVCQLVGEDWFRAAAGVYARARPPRDGLLMDYGAGFGGFLAGFEPAAGLPYLPAVARLDRCWTECHLAADATAVDRGWWARQAPGALPCMRLRPHPAARWPWCDEHPAYALWQRHRDGLDIPTHLAWVGDGGLLTRPRAEVAWRPLSRAGMALLDACAGGLPLEAAATCALATDPATDLAALMGALLDAGALVQPPSHTG
ncbi:MULTISPECIES: DNA-binding domain-containing protein [unclassified Acidovorax]|uniref:HvfC/BufC N-terminal domain-containing protein n=1 Tax=unclassified Acidovorax TaxID=2684926 RepID=UPI001C43D095|nr:MULTISPECIES: DNA-binding domain-containing protein [unclassified Acidovorax]MBV7428837.1 DNA-binding domain-containing protein [Acidovorax sp. sif0732]MBV7450663.1 DNA-binding domain-containing protein [Acidovorax sp. sif0715]